MPISDSSTEDTVDQVDSQQDGQTAGSSAADDKGEKSPASMLDALKAASTKSAEGSPASEGNQEEDGTDPDAAKAEGQAEEDDADELNDEDAQRFNQRNRKRVQKLLDQRRDLRIQVESLSPKAAQYDKIVEFQKEAGLSTDEVSSGFEIMRLVKHNPDGAWDALLPYMQHLAVVTGRVLPADLQKQVKDGQITQAAALELSRARAKNAFHSETSQRQTQQQKTEAEQRQNQEAIATMASTVTALERQWSSSDPDYSVKQARVAERLELKLRQGRIPRTPEEATKLANDCKAEVDKEFKRFRPVRVEQRPVNGAASRSAAPAPKSLREAMAQAVGR